MTQEDLTKEQLQQFAEMYEIVENRITYLADKLFNMGVDHWEIQNGQVRVTTSTYCCGDWETQEESFRESYLWDDDYLAKHMEEQRIRKEREERERQERKKREEEQRRIQKEKEDLETYERLRKKFENK